MYLCEIYKNANLMIMDDSDSSTLIIIILTTPNILNCIKTTYVI